MLCGIVFDSYITVCLLIHQIMSIWVVYNLGQLWKTKSEVAQSCLTLCDPMDSSLHQAPSSMVFSRQEYWSGLIPSQKFLNAPVLSVSTHPCPSLIISTQYHRDVKILIIYSFIHSINIYWLPILQCKHRGKYKMWSLQSVEGEKCIKQSNTIQWVL